MTTAAATAPIRVLLVEDNPGDARLIVELLRDVETELFTLERVERLEHALERLSGVGVDVILLDLGLPDSQGIETFQRTHLGAPDEPIVVISGLDDEALALEAMRSGAQDYLVKGRIEGRLLARVLRYAIERKRAEQTLREREERFRQMAENITEVFYVMNAAFTETLYVNPAYERIWGRSLQSLYDDPRSFVDPLLPEDRARVLENITRLQRGDDPGEVEFRVTRPDGQVRWVLSHAVPIRNERGEVYRITGVALDVTQRHGLEEQLRQAQKMEAIGRLAGGVAHDFNNVLTAIFGYADLMAEELPANSSGRSDLEEIRKAAQRATSLTRQLLAFSRRQVLQPVVLSLNDMIEDVDKMLRRLIGEDVELRLSLQRDVGNIRADPGQLQQVVLNLVVNSRDAMPQGGKLLIETANADLSAQYADMRQPVVPGPYVLLAVTDTGVGMDAATQTRIFEPFFTTKEVGRGTGLGLSTVYGIVQQSGGYVWVYSEVGRGTSFKVYLPRVDTPIEPGPPPRASGTLAGTETILLAEDDDLLRPLSRSLLEKLGYQVIEGENTFTALAAAAAHPGPVHLLVADVIMPGASGRELARRLAVMRPETKVLFVSGYTDDAIVEHGMLEPGLAFLQKPFTPAGLARKVREVLDAL